MRPRRRPPVTARHTKQRHDRPDDRAEDAGGLERAFVEVGAEQGPAEEAADEAADDPQQDRLADGHRVTAGNERSGHESGDQSDDEQVKDEAEHAVGVPAVARTQTSESGHRLGRRW